MPKSDREIMEILEAFDLTRCPEAAGRLAGCDAKTVKLNRTGIRGGSLTLETRMEHGSIRGVTKPASVLA